MADKFDRFTERARRVLTLAQEEAQRLNHNYIGTEHLLLGLVREGDGVAARVLSNMGVQLPKVRSAVEFIIGRGDAPATGEVGLTPRAKTVIELAVDEARRLNHHYIGTEHLLLGIVREGQGIAAGVLESLGVNLEKVRLQVLRVIVASGHDRSNGNLESAPGDLDTGNNPPRVDRFSPFSRQAKASLKLAEDEAIRLRHPSIGTEHILLGLIREKDGIAARVLRAQGGELAVARQAVERRSPGREATEPKELFLSRRANQVLADAVNQAKRLNRRQIGPEHLLLGLMRSDSCAAMRVIADLGIDSAHVRSALIRAIDQDNSWEHLVGYSRFTPRTRAVLAFAEFEADRLNHHGVGTEHVLLSIARDEDCIAAQMLVNLGVSPAQIRVAVEQDIQGGDAPARSLPGPTVATKALLEIAASEARLLKQDQIGTEHLLLGLLLEGEGIAASALERFGVRYQIAKLEVQRLQE